MPLKKHLTRRSGKISTGTLLMMAGASDVLMAGIMWIIMGQGDMIFSIVFGVMALSGVGLVAFGALQNLR
ncbi:hypothetical protein [Bremerella cremea]|uniref:hypothetical protein n=1 Tax=Bremerella cremea TaxID=1031537 RepID=UPI0031EE9E11